MSVDTGQAVRGALPALLRDKRYAAPSAFAPDSLLREPRRQKGVPDNPVPAICILDPDGDIVRHLRGAGRTRPVPGWACYHSVMEAFGEGGASTASSAADLCRGAMVPDLRQGTADPPATLCLAGARRPPGVHVDFDTSKPLLRELGVRMQSTLIAYLGAKETGRLTGATDPAAIKALLQTTAN